MDNIIYMKYGVHAGETVDSIVRRKQDEIAKVGYTFWGVWGKLLSPLNSSSTFCRECL